VNERSSVAHYQRRALVSLAHEDPTRRLLSRTIRSATLRAIPGIAAAPPSTVR